MYAETIGELSKLAAYKMAQQRRSLLAHLVRAGLAGMYIGAAIVLIWTIGGYLNTEAHHLVKLVMGICFGGALTIVLIAGSELYTGSTLVLTLGVLTRRVTTRDLLANWFWTWGGNLLGSALLAFLVVRSGILSMEPVSSFVLKSVHTKMNLPPEQLLWRGVLANWLVCLGVWMNSRLKTESGKIIMIWWCMFTFITCSFEHSVANMSGLLLGLWLPHGSMPEITWGGYVYNLAVVTAGNAIGGAIFVGGMYWLASPSTHTFTRAEGLSTEVVAAAPIAVEIPSSR